MDYTTFLPTLALVTLLAVALFALWDKRKTEARKADPHAPKSTLAADTPDTFDELERREGVPASR